MENEERNSDIKTPIDLTNVMDAEFGEFYFHVIKTCLSDIDDNFESLRHFITAMRKVANSMCEFNNPDEEPRLDEFMSSPHFRFTYIFKNSTLLSSAVAFHFENVLYGNAGFLDRIFQQPELRICSLGGGPASDVVAVVKILDLMAQARDIELNISVSVIDVDNDWKGTCLAVLRHLRKSVKASLKIEFLQADLSKFYTAETLEAIENAHIVLMVKLLSEFIGSHLDFRRTLKVLTEVTQSDSLLFVLDRPKKHYFRQCGGHSGILQDFDLIYEEAYDLHTLDIDSIAKIFFLYGETYENTVSNTCLKIFVRIWLKLSSSEPSNASFIHKRFLAQKEKYDAQRYLNKEVFHLLENNFIEKMAKLGFKRRSFELHVSSERQLRSDMYDSLIGNLRSLDSIRKFIHEEIHETGEISSSSWEKYIKCKMDLSYWKRAMYCELVIQFRGCLKWKIEERSASDSDWRKNMVKEPHTSN